MKKVADNDLEMARKVVENQIKQRYKRPLWERIFDVIGILLFGIASIFLALGLIMVIIMLIENPLTVAIICGTILLMWFWGSR